MDFDPRDSDSRDDQRWEQERDRSGTRDADDGRDDSGLSEARSRDRDADQAPSLGRGPSDESKHDRGSDPREDPRWGERDREGRDRDRDPREVFTRHLDLPRGLERELVRDRDRSYSLRGSESRTLATVGAFRVVSSRDLRDHHDRPADPRSGDLRHLREERLIDVAPLHGHRDVAVVLTDRARDLLDSHRRDRGDSRPDRDRGARDDARQAFYAGLRKEREVEHDVQVYRAYERVAERLQERDARLTRVVLDYELKREYQRFLQERNRGRADSDGRPDRTQGEMHEWALDHDLPHFDGHVHFPDVRIEYQTPDGRHDHEDVEVVTVHYRGAHGAAAARSGFTSVRGSSARTGGSSFDPDVAGKLLR